MNPPVDSHDRHHGIRTAMMGASFRIVGFRDAHHDDPTASDMLSEGIRAFAADATRLDNMIAEFA